MKCSGGVLQRDSTTHSPLMITTATVLVCSITEETLQSIPSRQPVSPNPSADHGDLSISQATSAHLTFAF